MSECRVCLVKNVKMYLLHNTWYQEMYKKLSGVKLENDGRPETICYVCRSQIQKFYSFFEMAQNAENILTNRLLFGAKLSQETEKFISLHNLKLTSVQSFSFVDNGEDEVEPEVTVTVKEEPIDEETDLKEEYLDSQFTEEMIEEDITKIVSTPDIHELPVGTKTWPLDKEFKDVIKTEDNSNITESILRNLTLALDMKYTKKYFYCDKCHYKTKTSNGLSRHSIVHNTNYKFSCEFCAYRFINEKKLSKHRNYCTVCSICSKRFANVNGLRTHVRLHTGIQPYNCTTCGRGFNQKTNLQTHLRVHSREKQYPCDLCNKSFPFKSFLQRHMLIHSGNIDAESFRRIIDCHKLMLRKRRELTTCKICGKVLSKNSLTMHMRLHTGVKLFCERCDKVFTQKCNLLTHVERVHKGDENFCCQICRKIFPYNIELRTHLAVHDTDMICANEFDDFQMKNLFKIHSDIHKGEIMPYRCDLCGTTRVLSY